MQETDDKVSKAPGGPRKVDAAAGHVAQGEFGEVPGEVVEEQVADVSGGEHNVVGPRGGADAVAGAHLQQHPNRERVLQQTHAADDRKYETGEEQVPVLQDVF